jgi:hypothetical protein
VVLVQGTFRSRSSSPTGGGSLDVDNVVNYSFGVGGKYIDAEILEPNLCVSSRC